jgi:hypothetical protein
MRRIYTISDQKRDLHKSRDSTTGESKENETENERAKNKSDNNVRATIRRELEKGKHKRIVPNPVLALDEGINSKDVKRTIKNRAP